MKKILITGGNGFIGRHLTRKLIFLGHNVTVCDFKQLPPYQRALCSTEIQDVRDFIDDLILREHLPALYPETEKFDYIFHLAAKPRVADGLTSPGVTLNNNIGSTVKLLDYIRTHPEIKMIFSSSSLVGHANFSINPYALSKKVCEELIDTYVNTYGVNVTSARLFNVFGPGEVDNGVTSTLIKKCKMAYLENEPINIYGDGSQTRAFTFIDDIINGFISIMNDMDTGNYNKLYELGQFNKSTSVLDIVKEFAEDHLEINFTPARPADCQTTNSNKDLWPTGWEPTVDVLDYIRSWKDSGCPND